MNGHSRRWQRGNPFLRRAFRVAGLLPALCGVLVSSCHAATKPEESVQVEVRHVGFDRLSNSPVVILQDKERRKAMPIWIGASEAQAIALELQGVLPPRPLTHDLLKNILEQAGVEFKSVMVSEIKGTTYYARISLVTAGKPFEVDSRPSDAIALALRFHRPIFVAKELFESALPVEGPASQPEPTSLKVAGVTVQNLTAELASYFNLPDTSGVLVADSEQNAGAEYVQRGDVIVAVDGETVRDVADFREKLSRGKGRHATVRVQRDGKELGVFLTPTAE